MALLEVKNLSAGYTDNVIRNVSFCLERGEIVGLLGKNGSGKTTLLRALTGNIRASGGSVTADGLDILSMKPGQRAKWMALMTQQIDILQGIRAGEFICMGRYAYTGPFSGLTKQDLELCKKAAEQIGVLPLWDQDCTTLSQGQRQLVQLAAVTAQDAEILLLDEPSSALDFDNSHRIFSHLQKLTGQRHKSALVVIHDPMQALNCCDRLLRLEKGTLTGSLEPGRASMEEVQDFFGRLYPGMAVRKDLQSNAYYCIMN